MTYIYLDTWSPLDSLTSFIRFSYDFNGSFKRYALYLHPEPGSHGVSPDPIRPRRRQDPLVETPSGAPKEVQGFQEIGHVLQRCGVIRVRRQFRGWSEQSDR